MGLDLGFLPSVIALPLAGYRREPDPLLRLWAMCDSVEMTLRLVVALGLGDWQRHGGLPDGLRRELAPRIQQPTLGKWRGMALALAKHQPEGSLFPQLAPFVVDALEPFMVGDGP